MISKKTAIMILIGVIVLMLLSEIFLKPFPQPQSYHHFADTRSWLGINNAWNVLSNISFALVGIWGLFLLFIPEKVQFVDNRERWPWIGVALGLILVAIGSSYYHLAPDNARLVWDRLPMTIVFMSFVAALWNERTFKPDEQTWGLCLWLLLLSIGIFSVVYWKASMQHGEDLRPYLYVQLFTFIAVFVMLLMPSRYSRRWDLVVVGLFYGLAVLCEALDHQIFALTHGIISGHTLKHFAAAAASAELIWMIWKRKIR